MMQCILCDTEIHEIKDFDDFVSFVSFKEKKEIFICKKCWKELLLNKQ